MSQTMLVILAEPFFKALQSFLFFLFLSYFSKLCSLACQKIEVTTFQNSNKPWNFNLTLNSSWVYQWYNDGLLVIEMAQVLLIYTAALCFWTMIGIAVASNYTISMPILCQLSQSFTVKYSFWVIETYAAFCGTISSAFFCFIYLVNVMWW